MLDAAPTPEIARAVAQAEQAAAILDGLDLTTLRRLAHASRAARRPDRRPLRGGEPCLSREERVLAAAEQFAGCLNRLRKVPTP